MKHLKKFNEDLQEDRDDAIDNVTNYSGLSVVIRNEQEYNQLRKFLGEDVAYLPFVPQMATKETGVIVFSFDDDFGVGAVGSAEYQRKNFFRTVEFKDFFKL